MQEADFNSAPFAKAAVMQSLVRHGGSLRVGPLLALSSLSVDELCAVLEELAQRRWLKVARRRSPSVHLPERLRRVDRVTATRFGRSRMPRFNYRADAPAFPRA
jgi:hypothetical protein